MLLAIDIGNSDIVFGVFDAHQWLPTWRHPSSQYLSVEETLHGMAATHQLDLRAFDRLILSSVVPGVTPQVRATLARLCGREPLMVGPGIYEHLDIGIDNPQEIGSDLVANAVAGHTRAGDQPCIVVDFGTALTFTSVAASGQILGVAIAPGLRTAMQALFFNTAQLPVVPLDLPASAIGKNTAHALQAGILIGYIGLVKELITRTSTELGGQCRVFATGGLAGRLSPLHDYFDEIDPMLTLDGLRLIADRVYGD
ncbi:MAG: type III pantothenate kinase [Bacteroidia bacterium]